MLKSRLSLIGSYLNDVAKLFFELVQIILASAAFGFASLKVSNQVVSVFADLLQAIGAVYIAFNFSIRTADFAVDLVKNLSNPFAVLILPLLGVPTVYFTTKFMQEISVSLTNAIVVTLG